MDATPTTPLDIAFGLMTASLHELDHPDEDLSLQFIRAIDESADPTATSFTIIAILVGIASSLIVSEAQHRGADPFETLAEHRRGHDAEAERYGDPA